VTTGIATNTHGNDTHITLHDGTAILKTEYAAAEETVKVVILRAAKLSSAILAGVQHDLVSIATGHQRTCHFGGSLELLLEGDLVFVDDKGWVRFHSEIVRSILLESYEGIGAFRTYHGPLVLAAV
jgi:hypothetical protein